MNKSSRASLLNSEIDLIDQVNLASLAKLKTSKRKIIPKHQKMASSPFLFYRGSAQLFYADLASGSVSLPEPLLSLPLTTIMGDCHTSNFGFLTEEGSHCDNVIFCPNDYDDACIGHASWDLLRFTTSLYLCFLHCKNLTHSRRHQNKILVPEHAVEAAAQAFLTSYTNTCMLGLDESLAGNAFYMTALDKKSESFSASSLMQKAYKKATRRASQGRDFTTKSALAKAVDLSQDTLQFRNHSEKFKPLSRPKYNALKKVFAPYMDDNVQDIVERLGAGTGSVNMQRYYFLVGPNKMQNKRDLALNHIVEVKQQRVAAPLYYFSNLSAVNSLPPAHLTQVCQKRMQRKPDLVLDEVIYQRKHWLVRSRHHARVGFDPEDIMFGKPDKIDISVCDYASACGKSLALAHSRSDRRSNYFEQAVVDTLPKYTEDLITQAKRYCEQVVEDCNWLQNLISATQ